MKTLSTIVEAAEMLDELFQVLDEHILDSLPGVPERFTLGEAQVKACEVIVKTFGEPSDDSTNPNPMPTERTELLALAAVAVLKDRYRMHTGAGEHSALIAILELLAESMRSRGFGITREALLNYCPARKE